MVECYQIAKKRQCPPPPDGYKFARRDNVVSTVRLPPSPCKCCGSSKHWDKECPHYHVWMKKYGKGREREVRLAEGGTGADTYKEETFESLYDSAFDNLNERAGFSFYLDPEV